MRRIYRFNEDRDGFGKKLKELMKKNGYTIESFINEFNDCPINENTVKKWRSGERIPDMKTIKILANMFHVTMHDLYMPNSTYVNSFSDGMHSFLNRRTTIDNLTLNEIIEVKEYSEYLFQKLLFSFLSFAEKENLNTMFSCFRVTEYGREKLDLKDDCLFETFYANTKEYIQRKYGKSLPYKIDKGKSEEIYRDFERMVEFKSKGDKRE